jgi:WXXGXW repeat (2 copies)
MAINSLIQNNVFRPRNKRKKSGFIWAECDAAGSPVLDQNGEANGKAMKMKRSARRLLFGLVIGVLMLTVSVLSLSTASSAQIGIGISVRIGPPALPVYAQPICPGPGFLWTPGYWAWNDDGGYYWVPGTWVIAPVGMLWTPGYWGWGGGFYAWHMGYWGRHVGFYGGINYGYGYGGVGFFGGEWRGGSFFYNRSVVNVNVTRVTNVYTRTVVANNTRNVSYNGGSGGIDARPTRQEGEYEREPHTAALAAQTQHEHAASQNRQLFASENHGRPAIAATAKPGEFRGHNVERARAAGEPYHKPKISPQEARVTSAGNRGSETPARNGGNVNDRVTTRPENREARNNQARDNEATNREQTSSRNNPRPVKQERAAQEQAKADQKPLEKANRAEAKAEQKRNAHDQRR